MTRQISGSSGSLACDDCFLCLVRPLVCCLLPVSGAGAVDLPVRKAGLWEMKMVRTGAPVPEMTMQHCTDETTDKEMSTAFSPMGKEICSKQDIQKTATGYVSDSVCGIAGMTITSHAEITGDFNSAYTVKSTVAQRGRRRPARRATPPRRSRRNGSAPARPTRSPATS